MSPCQVQVQVMVAPEISSSDTLFSAEIPEEPGYRPVSRLAIGAFAMALLSVTALIHPVLWILPLLAVGVCLIARRHVNVSDNRLSGQTLIAGALALALVVGVYAPTRFVTRRARLGREARERAEKWLELVKEGRLKEAHQLHLPQAQRQAPGKPLEEFYQRTPEPGDPSQMMVHDMISPSAELATFFGNEPLKEIVAAGPPAQFEFTGYGDVEPLSRTSESIELFYRAELPGSSPLPMKLRLVRTLAPEVREASWHVEWVLRETRSPS